MKLKEFVPTQCLQAQKLKSDRGLDQYCGNGEFFHRISQFQSDSQLP